MLGADAETWVPSGEMDPIHSNCSLSKGEAHLFFPPLYFFFSPKEFILTI